MASYERQDGIHGSEPNRSDPLAEALHDVPIPAGLETRILSELAAHGTVWGEPRRRWTRRGWLTAAVAAGCSGIMISGGSYAWLRRPLRIAAVERAVLESLTQRNWLRNWMELPAEGEVDGIHFPRELRSSHGWQYRRIGLGNNAVAYDVSIPGCVAVLFAMRTWRDIADFPATPPDAPRALSGQPWKSLAVWQHQQRFLYALAMQGSRRQYLRLITPGGTAPLA